MKEGQKKILICVTDRDKEVIKLCRLKLAERGKFPSLSDVIRLALKKLAKILETKE